MTDLQPPDADSITRHIVETYPGVDVVTAYDATFFSLDPEKHWPNFATIVTTDEHDEGTPSQLHRPDVFRLNIGVSRDTFERLVGADAEPDHTALDRILPHPVYARQHWICILNPSRQTFETVVGPLLDEAHRRVAAQGERRAGQD